MALLVALLIFLFESSCFVFLQADASGHHGGLSLWSQRAALLQWKSALRSSPALLDSWREGTSPCSSNWTGFACSVMRRGHGTTLAVTRISLPNAGAEGTLRELNFSALPFLTHIDLSFNGLNGEIPPAIASLAELSYLDLTSNSLRGQIPFEIGNMGRLSQLGLGLNNLTGPIPASLGNLTKLVELVLNQNLLTGSIPEELGKLTGLQSLGLSDSLLSGQIPESLGNLTALSILHLYGNKLSGPIPSSLYATSSTC